mmetsp:Transcript_22954/g.56075  ORF Transcript_22954/g.56075 Transcript_22954/m.56075 type:complete len:585 (+) Transcript_22954:16-1770(+)
MGIKGLLEAVRPAAKEAHLSAYSGLRMAVDMYCLLHRGVYHCATDLMTGRPTTAHIQSCVSRIEMLIAHGITPICVFDGGPLPMKKEVEEERKRARQAAREKGLEALRAGDPKLAHKFFAQAVDVSPEMAAQVIAQLRRINDVQCIVAPYEADAQLTFLALNGHCDVVMSEDSDLLAFGCRRVFFKLDSASKCGQEVCLDDLRARSIPSSALSFQYFSDDDFLNFCVLCGCDYLPNIKGFGPQKVFKLFQKSNADVTRFVHACKLQGAPVPEDYLECFEKARQTFMHQSVFDPGARKFSSVRPIPENSGLAGEAFLGATYDDDVLCQVADGFVDPVTQRPFVRSEPPPLTSEFVEEGTEDFCPRASSGGGWIRRAARSGDRPARHDPGYSLSSAAPQPPSDRQPPTKKPRQVTSPATAAAGQVAITKFFAKSHKASQKTAERRPVVIRRPGPAREAPAVHVLDEGVQQRAKQMGGFAFTRRRDEPEDEQDQGQLESPSVVVTPSHPALASLAHLAFAAASRDAAAPRRDPPPAAPRASPPVRSQVDALEACCAGPERLENHSDLSRFACPAREEMETEQVAVRA